MQMALLTHDLSHLAAARVLVVLLYELANYIWHMHVIVFFGESITFQLQEAVQPQRNQTILQAKGKLLHVIVTQCIGQHACMYACMTTLTGSHYPVPGQQCSCSWLFPAQPVKERWSVAHQ